MPRNIVGIDLGTTMSAISKLNQLGKPEIISTKDGERIMPSIVHFSDVNNEVLIGADAKAMLADSPERTAKEFKRLIHDKDFKFVVDNEEYTPIQLSAFILKKLVQDASSQEGEIHKVVISVPAYFREYERKATIEAGRLAGLDVIGVINEPTAAAIYYASKFDLSGNYLIYDLGGGTFDISLVKIEGKEVKVLNSLGNHELGGIDFDRAILKLVEDKFRAEKGRELIQNESERAGLLLRAEELKKVLSKHKKANKNFITENERYKAVITRDEFNKSISTFLTDTELLMSQVLDDVGFSKNDIKNVLLVGGSTRIEAIRNSIKSFIGKDALDLVNVDEAVALGAALRAGLREDITELSDMKVEDVANHSYGVIFYEGNSDNQVNQIIIKKNSILPVTKTTTGYTRYDGQERTLFEITQGEDTDPNYVDIIDEVILELPEGRPEGQPIDVTYSYDENQIMHCRIYDVNSKREKSKEINLSLGNKNPLNDFDLV